MNVFESIKLALDSIRVNKLRAFLTLLSISIGVFAIIGAGTLVSSLSGTVEKQLDEIGENTFWIQKMPKVVTGNNWRKYMKRKPITYTQMKELKRTMTTTNLIAGVSYSMGNTVKAGNLSSNPDVDLIGSDEIYFSNMNVSISEGRIFTEDEINQCSNVALIGNDVKVKVFPNMNPIGKRITIKNQNYEVIGMLESKGATLGRSQDNVIYIPISGFLKYYSSEWNESVTITIKAIGKGNRDATIGEAIGSLRVIRNLKPWEENDFEMDTNETITEQFSSFIGFLTYFGFFSGAIALIAAGVGIMNIMLVSVKERTREIGIRKAIGAKRKWILMQFIVETITLCQIGGLAGIIMGVGGGWALGSMAHMTIVFPVNWLIGAVVLCTVLGLLSGAYPAWKAAKLDPIEALRYE